MTPFCNDFHSNQSLAQVFLQASGSERWTSWIWSSQDIWAQGQRLEVTQRIKSEISWKHQSLHMSELVFGKGFIFSQQAVL